MKLGEALNLRADYGRRLNELRTRITSSAIASEGEQPPEDVNALLLEADHLADDFERIVAAINWTNARVEVKPGQTITQAIAHRDAIALKQGALKAGIDAVTGGRLGLGLRFGRNELVTNRYVDPAALRKAHNALSLERRELDTKLQQANWTVDLIES